MSVQKEPGGTAMAVQLYRFVHMEEHGMSSNLLVSALWKVFGMELFV